MDASIWLGLSTSRLLMLQVCVCGKEELFEFLLPFSEQSGLSALTSAAPWILSLFQTTNLKDDCAGLDQ